MTLRNGSARLAHARRSASPRARLGPVFSVATGLFEGLVRHRWRLNRRWKSSRGSRQTPATESNCVAEGGSCWEHPGKPATRGNAHDLRMRGGEQLDVELRAATKVNSIRLRGSASLQGKGEALTHRVRRRRAEDDRGCLFDREDGSNVDRVHEGGWRQHGAKVKRSKMGSTAVGSRLLAAADRDPTVALKRRNGRGARGVREMET